MQQHPLRHRKHGISLIIVLFILFMFAAMYPTVYLQSMNGIDRTVQLEKSQRFNRILQSSIELASASLYDLRATPPATFSHTSTFLYQPGAVDLQQIRYSITVIGTDTPDGYSFSTLATTSPPDEILTFSPSFLTHIGTFPRSPEI